MTPTRIIILNESPFFIRCLNDEDVDSYFNQNQTKVVGVINSIDNKELIVNEVRTILTYKPIETFLVEHKPLNVIVEDAIKSVMDKELEEHETIATDDTINPFELSESEQTFLKNAALTKIRAKS